MNFGSSLITLNPPRRLLPFRTALAAPLVLLLTATFGCKKESVTGPAASPPSEVRLGYFANATHAQAVLGVSSGDFEKALAPSTFTTKVYNAGPELIEALNAGNIDLGYVGPGPALNGFVKSGGKGLRVIAGQVCERHVAEALNGFSIPRPVVHATRCFPE